MGLRKSSSSSMNRGVTATNLVVNGNFASGTTGWALSSTGPITVLNNIGSFTATATGGYIYPPLFNLTTGSKYYYTAFVKSSSNLIQLSLAGAVPDFHSGSNLFERLSSLWTSTITVATNLRIGDGRASLWDNIDVTNALTINLTVLFGAGNEPTLVECDRIFADWFGGTTGLQQTLSPNSPLRN